MIKYFVSFVSQKRGAMIVGHAAIDLEKPVRNMEDIDYLAGLIKKDNLEQVTVLNWRRFEQE